MARRPDNPRPGLLVIDKPHGPTSHDVVARVRRLAHTRKVGHAGTLDPMATGVLVIGIGKATKLLTWVSGDSKEYEATIRFGISTNTDDAQGQITGAAGCTALTPQQLEETFAPLRGDIMQVPSTVSAIKVDGQRAYALARAGHDVQLAARPIHIAALNTVGEGRPGLVNAPLGQEAQAHTGTGNTPVVDVDVRVVCSSGTYIRALARDAGQAVGCGAHLVKLRRTRVGAFEEAQALTLEELEQRVSAAEGGAESSAQEAQPQLPLLELSDAARSLFPSLTLTQAEARVFAHGQAPKRTPAEIADLPPGPLCACEESGRVLGLIEAGAKGLKTILVFVGEHE